MPGFGSGLGEVIGANMADNHLDNALSSVGSTASTATTGVNDISAGFANTTAPYNTFGQSFISPATSTIGDAKAFAGGTQGYSQFMDSYKNTPAAEYQIQQADAVQNNSAAARGGLLSGSNNRALATVNNGIVAQNANTAYNEYLAGNNQQFGQLEAALGNMFSAIGVGQTATGQQAGVDAAQIGATSSIANANMGATTKIADSQAKNDKDKGSGIGSMFGGVGSMFAF